MSNKRNPKSQFTAPPGYDVRDRCELFKAATHNEDFQMFLAHLYRTVFVHGGAVHIQEDCGSDYSYQFRKNVMR